MNFLDVFIVSASAASVVAACGIVVVVVHMVVHYFRTLPSPEPCEPYLVTEFPDTVRVARSQGQTDWAYLELTRVKEPALNSFFRCDWEWPLCQKLGGGEYRMELRFYRVEGDNK